MPDVYLRKIPDSLAAMYPLLYALLCVMRAALREAAAGVRVGRGRYDRLKNKHEHMV